MVSRDCKNIRCYLADLKSRMNSSNSNCGGKRMISNLKLDKHKFTCDVDKDFDTINWSPIDFGVQEEPYRGWYKLNTNEESYPAGKFEREDSQG